MNDIQPAIEMAPSMSQPYQVMPALTADEYEALKADIAVRGVQIPVEYDDLGNILDGHHRVQICQELQIANWPRLVRHGLSCGEKRQHARRLNLDRRHLDREQRRQLIAEDCRDVANIRTCTSETQNKPADEQSGDLR